MDKKYDDLGYRIRTQLDAVGKSQKELADEIGITEVSLSRYIAGNRTPRANIISSLAKALNTTTDYLLGKETGSDFESGYLSVRAWIIQNAGKMSAEQKMALIAPLFQSK